MYSFFKSSDNVSDEKNSGRLDPGVSRGGCYTGK